MTVRKAGAMMALVSVVSNRPLAWLMRATRLVAVSQLSTRTASKKLQTMPGTLLVNVSAYSRICFSLAVAYRASSMSTARASPDKMHDRKIINTADLIVFFME